MDDIENFENLSQNDLLDLLDDFSDNKKETEVYNSCIDNEPCNLVQDISNGTIDKFKNVIKKSYIP